MAMYKFDWSVFVTDDLVRQIKSLSQLNAGDPVDRIQTLVENILSASGGLPITSREYPPQERTEIARGLLHEGVKKVIHLINLQKTEFSSYLTRASSVQELESIAHLVEKAPINSSSFEVLDSLPGIGAVLARRIIEERSSNGPFTSLTDLHQRVNGLGEQNVKSLANALLVDDPAETAVKRLVVTGGFDQDFSTLVASQKGGSNLERLVCALDLIATTCSGDLHPFTRNGLVREFDIPANETDVEADWVGVLFGTEYFMCLPQFLLNANSSIDVCMFHIAYPVERHPTFDLLDALKTAHNRGVNVRVLIDQDRPDDPYLSTIINSNAKKFFDQNGIECKYDKAERLMHSKYLLIDEDLAVLGSHNWSAGSYFHFDDLSLAVKSAQLVSNLRLRFNELWNSN